MRRNFGLFCALVLLAGVIFAVPVNAFAISGSQYVPSERNSGELQNTNGENVDPTNYPNLTSEQIKSIVSDCEFKICDVNKLLYEENKKAEQTKQDNSLIGRLKSLATNVFNSAKLFFQKAVVIIKPLFTRLINFNRNIFSFVSTPNHPIVTNLPFPFNLIYKLLFGQVSSQKPAPKQEAMVPQVNVEENQDASMSKYASELNNLIDNTATSKFKYGPFDSNIPEKAKEVYGWSTTWDPGLHPNDYLQCTTYVYMLYNMGGIKLPLRLGNAKNWPTRTDVFDVYTSGADFEPIKVNDIMIWDDPLPFGHAGVVIKKDQFSIQIANANSDQTTHTYQWRMVNGKIKIFDKYGVDSGWNPDHWLRPKEQR